VEETSAFEETVEEVLAISQEQLLGSGASIAKVALIVAAGAKGGSRCVRVQG
jgi:hypothetical protein